MLRIRPWAVLSFQDDSRAVAAAALNPTPACDGRNRGQTATFGLNLLFLTLPRADGLTKIATVSRNVSYKRA
jgi:hypothetical protein